MKPNSGDVRSFFSDLDQIFNDFATMAFSHDEILDYIEDLESENESHKDKIEILGAEVMTLEERIIELRKELKEVSKSE
jgi:peptidoglycan hydrolase CwlO-like protein